MKVYAVLKSFDGCLKSEIMKVFKSRNKAQKYILDLPMSPADCETHWDIVSRKVEE